MKAEVKENLGYEKRGRVSENTEEGVSKNYRNGYPKKTVKPQLGEIGVKIPRHTLRGEMPRFTPRR